MTLLHPESPAYCTTPSGISHKRPCECDHLEDNFSLKLDVTSRLTPLPRGNC